MIPPTWWAASHMNTQKHRRRLNSHGLEKGKGLKSTFPFSAMTTHVPSLKTPPVMAPGMTWFDYEKVIKYWSIIADVDKKKQGTLLKLSVTRENEVYRNYSQDSISQSEGGVDYCLKTLKPHFVREDVQVFMYRFLLLNGCRRGPQGDFRYWLV